MFQLLRDSRGSYLEVVHTLKEAFELLGLESPHFSTIVWPQVPAAISTSVQSGCQPPFKSR
jgi:hypothetical protein